MFIHCGDRGYAFGVRPAEIEIAAEASGKYVTRHYAAWVGADPATADPQTLHSTAVRHGAPILRLVHPILFVQKWLQVGVPVPKLRYSFFKNRAAWLKDHLGCGPHRAPATNTCEPRD